MIRAARGLEFFSVALPRPDDFVTGNRTFYTNPYSVDSVSADALKGLFPYERDALEKFAPIPGAALVLGCGAGREAIAIAQRGWHVVGVDLSPSLIDGASRCAHQAGVTIEWICGDITADLSLDRRFDLVCLFGLVYSLIPGRTKRIAVLRSCRRHMKPGAVCLLDFGQHSAVSRRAQLAHQWRRRLARLVGGNVECELGDAWYAGGLFFHSFVAVEDLADETTPAGFVLDIHSNGSHAPLAVLRAASQTPSAY